MRASAADGALMLLHTAGNRELELGHQKREQELERQERQLVYEQKVTVQGPLVGLAGGGECGSCQDRGAGS